MSKIVIIKLKYCFDLSRNITVSENTRGFPDRSFILHSPWDHRSFCSRVCAPFLVCVRSPFYVHKSFTNSVLRSHTVHSSRNTAFDHRSLSVRTVQMLMKNVSGTVTCRYQFTSTVYMFCSILQYCISWSANRMKL